MNEQLTSIYDILQTTNGPSANNPKSSTPQGEQFSKLLAENINPAKQQAPATTDNMTVSNQDNFKIISLPSTAGTSWKELLAKITLTDSDNAQLTKLLQSIKSTENKKLNIALPALMASLANVKTSENTSDGNLQPVLNIEELLQLISAPGKTNNTVATNAPQNQTNENLTSEQAKTRLKTLLAKISGLLNNSSKQKNSGAAEALTKNLKGLLTDQKDNEAIKKALESAQPKTTSPNNEKQNTTPSDSAKPKKAPPVQNGKLNAEIKLSAQKQNSQVKPGNENNSNRPQAHSLKSTYSEEQIKNSTLQPLAAQDKKGKSKNDTSEPAATKNKAAKSIYQTAGKNNNQNSSIENHLKELNLTKLKSPGPGSQPRCTSGKQTAGANSNDSSSSAQMQTTGQQSQAAAAKIFTNNIGAQAAKGANNPSAGNTSADIGKQLADNIYSSLTQSPGNRQLSIRLHPPELGKVFIRFREQQNQITGLLQVSKMQTHNEIAQALPDIIKTLQQAGLQIKQLEVSLTDHQQQQPMFKDETPGENSTLNNQGRSTNGQTQQETAENQQEHGNEAGTLGLPEPQLLRAEDSLNLLI